MLHQTRWRWPRIIAARQLTLPWVRPAPALQVSLAPPYAVDDATFKKLVAILRIAVPYTGMILRCGLGWGVGRTRLAGCHRIWRMHMKLATWAWGRLLLPAHSLTLLLLRPHLAAPPCPLPCSTRESPEMRRELLRVGMSQVRRPAASVVVHA